MTINLSDNDPRVSYDVAAGVTQTSFTVSFEFFDNDDLNVYVDGTLKTLTTDYTVTGGDGSTGTVTMSVTGASGGSKVVITRDIDLDRTTDFPSSGPFNIASLNTELDRFVAIAADLKDQADRSLQLTDFDVAASLTLPEVDDRKGKTLAFNATSGAVEAGPTISNVQSVADAAADIQTLAHIEDGTDATDAIQTVAGISSDVTTVSGISGNVTTVAGNNANVTTVAGISSNVSTVAGISSDVTTVAGISSDVTTVAADGSDIGTVAGISANVTTVAGISGNVTTVAGQTTNLQNVTDNLSAIQNAATNATNAANSATAAAASAAAAALSADTFDDTYLGSKASDPSTDNDGDALTAGDLYFNTTDNKLKVYSGSAWQTAALDSSGFVETTGDTMTGNLSFGDNDKAIFGAGSDLQIYHDTSDSIINDNGTGSLKLQTGGSTKLEVTSTGIDVTGTVTADGLTVDGSAQNVVLSHATDNVIRSNANSSRVRIFGGSSASVGNGAALTLNGVDYTGGNYADLASATGGSIRFRTGTTERMRIDSSGNVGIGVTSVIGKLHADDSSGATLTLTRTSGATSGNLGKLRFGNTNVDSALASIIAIQDGATDNSAITFGTQSSGAAEAERMRIDSSGNLLVGTTSTVTNDVGFKVFQSTGQTVTTADGTNPVLFNRKTSDGDIAIFRKDDTTVGSISVDNGNLYIASPSGTNPFGVMFIKGSQPRFVPTNTSGGVNDSVVDLGYTNARWEDVYASNGTIQTSDQNEKQQIASLTDAEITAAKAISKLFKTFKWNDSVTEKGDAARTHTGVIAQQVETAMTDAGLNAGDYAFFISSTWWETQTEVPAVEADEENGIEAQEAYTRTDTYMTLEEAPEGATERNRKGIRYPQLLSFVAAATEQRLASIETRLEALEGA